MNIFISQLLVFKLSNNISGMFFIIFARLSYFLKDFYPYLILILLSVVVVIYLSFKIYQKKIPKRKKYFFVSLIFTTLFIILAYSFAEAYFRYTYDVPDGLGFLKINQKWHQRHVVFNNYFLRDRDFETEKKNGSVRIGVIGDSIAMGGGIENVQDRFSNLLEKKLKDSGKNVEVYNLGKSGYDTTQEKDAFQKVKHLNFDIIIWEYFINDAQPQDSTGTPIIVESSKQSKVVKFISEKSYFFDFMYWRFSQKYANTFQLLRTADEAQYKNEENLKNHKQQIAQFVKDIRENKSKIVVIMFPSLVLAGSNYPIDIHTTMKSVFEENKVEKFIDLYPLIKDKDTRLLIASKFDPHPNEVVHQIAGEELYKVLEQLLK